MTKVDNMTWSEFKARVDAELKKLDVDEDIVIHYIDVSFPERYADGLCISISDLGIVIDE